MGIVLRQGAKYAFANLLGVGLGAFNVLWLFPRYLATNEIGVLAALEGAAVLGSTVAGLGINVITDRFFPLHKDLPAKHGGYLGFLLVYVAIAWLFFCTLFFVLYDFCLGFYLKKSPELPLYFGWVYVYAGLLAIQYGLESFARVYLRIAIPNLLREFFLRILITISVLLYASQSIDFAQVVALRIASYAIICVLLLAYLLRLRIPFWYIDKRFFRKANIYPIVRFGFFTFWGAIGITLVMKLDVLMLGAMLNMSQVGVFSLAFFIGNVLEIPRKAIAQISQPILAQAWRENNLPLIQKMYAQSSRNAFVVGGWLFLGIWLNIDSLFAYIPHSEVYVAGKFVVLFICLTRLVDMGMGLNNEIITQSNYYFFNFLIVLLIIILVIGFNLLFIPIYGITGAALSSLIAIVVSNGLKFIFLYKRFGFQPLTQEHLVMALIIIGCFQIAWIPVLLPVWADMLARSITITLAYWGANIYFKTSPEFTTLWNVVKNKIKK